LWITRGTSSPIRRPGNTFVAAIIDVEALRQFRVLNLNSNWMKDLRTEIFQKMYEKPIHPKNLWLNQDPLHHAEVDEIYRQNIRRLIQRGTYTLPASSFKGAHYQSKATTARAWRKLKSLWEAWDGEVKGRRGRD
jgi:beta-ureidopropionase